MLVETAKWNGDEQNNREFRTNTHVADKQPRDPCCFPVHTSQKNPRVWKLTSLLFAFPIADWEPGVVLVLFESTMAFCIAYHGGHTAETNTIAAESIS